MYQFAKNLQLIFFFALLGYTIKAQEQLGLRLDNYAGISGVTLNPTAGMNNPLGWDLNIVSAGSFIANDFAFVRNASISSVYRNQATLGPAPETKIAYPTTPTKYIDFYNQPQEKFLSTTNFLSLPSFQINFQSGHSLGFFATQRAAVVTRQIPIIVDPYQQQNILLGQKTTLPPFVVTGMAWEEFGLNYAHRLSNDTEGGLSYGINIKILRGNQAFFVQNLEGTAVTRLTKDSTRIDAINAKAGFTNNFTTNALSANGSGLGLDFGVQYIQEANEPEGRPYIFRLGASLLDIGRILFNKNTEIHALKLTESVKANTKDYSNLNPNDPLSDALKRFNQQTFGRADSTYKGNYFLMALPSVFSLQGDIAFTENIFVNTLFMQRLPMGDNSLSRDNVLAIVPRFESRWIGASIPVSLLNYQQIRMGLAARLAFLTIGTDHLLSFLGQKRLSGTDFYMALKINPFQIGKIGNNGGFGSGNNRSKNVKCYRF